MTSPKLRPSARRWNALIFWVFLAASLAVLFISHGWGASPGQLALIGATLFLVGIALVVGRRRPPAAAPEPFPDAATPDEQRHALIYLATLPHLRSLSDGTVFDYLHGSRIQFCECGQHSPLHLEVRYGTDRQRAIALVSRSALAQYLSVQSTVAQHLFGKAV